ncbi:Low-density lipoprotein receptor class A domain-containing protein 4 [Varanus komodoensis]|nr:Low-density lipoprotein receptor class A domain-containing protein 4 [Varanus komodoensis]
MVTWEFKQRSKYFLRKELKSNVTDAALLEITSKQNCPSQCKFTCTSGKCLHLGSLVCNQQNDCGDNSDEENCLLVTEHPPPSIFSCKY